MPPGFPKDKKIKVIEYGTESPHKFSLKEAIKAFFKSISKQQKNK